MLWSGNPGSLHTANEDPTTIGVLPMYTRDLPFFVVMVRESPYMSRLASRLTESGRPRPAGGVDGLDCAKCLLVASLRRGRGLRGCMRRLGSRGGRRPGQR